MTGPYEVRRSVWDSMSRGWLEVERREGLTLAEAVDQGQAWQDQGYGAVIGIA